MTELPVTASPALWAKLAISFVLAAVAVVVVPRLASGGDQPNVGMLLATGVVVAALTTGALYVALRRDLGLPASIALYAVGYNALVVLVKFVLGPHGLYGLLVCVLAWLVLGGEGADDAIRFGFAATLAALFAGSLGLLAARPAGSPGAPR